MTEQEAQRIMRETGMVNNPRDIFADDDRAAECPEVYAVTSDQRQARLVLDRAERNAESAVAKRKRMLRRVGANMSKYRAKEASRYAGTDVHFSQKRG